MDQSRVTAELASKQRLRNAEFWGRVHKRSERRKVKRQIIVGVLAWAAVYVLALQGHAFSPLYELIGRAGIAGAVLIYGAPYLEWLLFPKDRPVKKVQWDPEKAYSAPSPSPQQSQPQRPQYNPVDRYAPFFAALIIGSPLGLIVVGLLADFIPQRPLLTGVALAIIVFAVSWQRRESQATTIARNEKAS